MQVRHSLMPVKPTNTASLPYYTKTDLPLPPPPTPTSSLYATSSYSSKYEGPTYEVASTNLFNVFTMSLQVPHPHGGKTPAPSLRYGYLGGPVYGGSHHPSQQYNYGPSKTYYLDRPSV